MARDWCLLENLYLCRVVVELLAAASIPPPGQQGCASGFIELIKRLAWLQKGCLATRMWLVGYGLEHGSTVFLCSGLMDDDDGQILTGRAITGAADW